MSRWLAHWGMTEAPFTKEIGDADLWVPASRKNAVERLVETCRDRGHAVLVGEPGVGKTCVLRALRHRLPESGFRLTYCHNATLGRRDFYRHVCLAIGLSPKASAAGVFYAIASHVEGLGSEKIHPVLLIDEAHLLHQDVLDHLHILTNYEWDSKALLSLILVGLPETKQRLALAKNRSLWSRVHARLSLGEATPGDTTEYVAHRMKRSGCDREVFTSDALALLHEDAKGRLRDIDRIATDALKLAAKRKHKTIDRELVGRILADAEQLDGE
jgi:type II secretory pathway predicted ATPase ExeA